LTKPTQVPRFSNDVGVTVLSVAPADERFARNVADCLRELRYEVAGDVQTRDLSAQDMVPFLAALFRQRIGYLVVFFGVDHAAVRGTLLATGQVASWARSGQLIPAWSVTGQPDESSEIEFNPVSSNARDVAALVAKRLPNV
jgi:hypothetical protein